MRKAFCQFLLKLHGWKIAKGLPEGVNKCVVIACPHTSNWDFYFTRVAFYVLGVPLRFTVKSSMTKFPFSLISLPAGAIAIERDKNADEAKRKSYIELMAEIIDRTDPIALIVTPEGTRSYRDEWKSGFYYLAKMAKVPIALGYLDFEKKVAGIGPLVYLSEDKDADMRKIMAFYKDIPGKHPEKFSVDKRYV